MKAIDTYQQIGKRIREAREKEGLSQKSLAEAVGFESATAISLIESGERRVSIEDLDKIGKLLKVTSTFLLGTEERKPNIKFALRADKDLSREDEKHILKFIDFVKKDKNGG